MRARLEYVFKLGAVAWCLGLLFAVQAKAKEETVLITCTGSTVCDPASGAFATQTTTADPPTFTVSNSTAGHKCPKKDTCQAYLAVLVPNGTLPAGFTVNGSGPVGTGTFTSASSSLFGALDENGGHDNTFTLWQTTSAAAGASITSAGSFTVYDFLIGTFTGPGPFSAAITLSGPVPIGTGFVAFYEDPKDRIINDRPMAHDITVTVTPEPGSMLLFGTGVLLLGAAIRRRSAKQE